MQEEVEKRLLAMCRTDPSEFVRRAAARFVSQWCCPGTGTVLVACLITMCDAVACDTDCDVKCTAIHFWRQCLTSIQHSITPSCCRTAVVAGSISCLLSAVLDCDRAVRVEALKTLVDVRRLAETCPTQLLPAKHGEPFGLFGDTSCDRICLNQDFLNASLRRLPQSFEHELSSDQSGFARSTEAVNYDGANGSELSSFVDESMGCYSLSLLTRLQSTLLSTDWESLFASESEMTDDCHAGNPASLLDDILKTARRECDVSNRNEDTDEDSIIMDCY